MQGDDLDLIAGRPETAADEIDRCLSELGSRLHEAADRGARQHHRGNLRERRGMGTSRLAIERGNLAESIASASMPKRKHFCLQLKERRDGLDRPRPDALRHCPDEAPSSTGFALLYSGVLVAIGSQTPFGFERSVSPQDLPSLTCGPKPGRQERPLQSIGQQPRRQAGDQNLCCRPVLADQVGPPTISCKSGEGQDWVLLSPASIFPDKPSERALMVDCLFLW